TAADRLESLGIEASDEACRGSPCRGDAKNRMVSIEQKAQGNQVVPWAINPAAICGYAAKFVIKSIGWEICWEVSRLRQRSRDNVQPCSAGNPAMSKVTRATQALEKAGVVFTVHTYQYDPNAERVGLQAAEALRESPDRVLKTLMAQVDSKPVCVIVPSDRE